MKPDWDKLMKNWNKSKRFATGLIADVDCTSDTGKPLCDRMGVKGFPSIKWGDPSALEDYEGGRSYDELKKFAFANVKPLCGPSTLDLCDEEKKQEIIALQALPAEELSANIEEKQSALKETESNFEASVKKLQEQYEQLQKDKEAKVAEIKASGLGLMLKVQAAANKASEKKDEL
mmetsp:Transcript_3928/g.7973  ORF Transcript_3928/g.7973 Transcript_3928/m.7973 type:complete len:176 (-) Transcript_3928:34-561(-)|eukprot:CAMPEP_0172720146 /NCGR_PEP_ID=MMETSP1074-20121228/76230_1 /TAXON_ID=2916 /ORGANISM="Ceratium fusus, Strain PA161109" /LENGTH=175 /DNA_ID=CAMNT_0013545597 /DNA_START=259 /DNA_END=786 /DNA_ORIENTATION=+